MGYNKSIIDIACRIKYNIEEHLIRKTVTNDEYNRVIALYFNEVGYCYSKRNIANLLDMEYRKVSTIIKMGKENGRIPANYKYTTQNVTIEECKYLYNIHNISIASLVKFYGLPTRYIVTILDIGYTGDIDRLG